jgi:hypothetical protein
MVVCIFLEHQILQKMKQILLLQQQRCEQQLVFLCVVLVQVHLWNIKEKDNDLIDLVVGDHEGPHKVNQSFIRFWWKNEAGISAPLPENFFTKESISREPKFILNIKNL